MEAPPKMSPAGHDLLALRGSLKQRQAVFQYWARWGKWSKYQPLGHIGMYFGEKVAFCFTWLDNGSLGLMVQGKGPLAASSRSQLFQGHHRQEIDTSEEQYWMCPLCKACQLSKIYSTFMARWLFDHGGTIFFSIFMSLWAALFLEFWKQTNTSLAHHWDCSEFEDIEERPWPQFMVMAPMTIINPITGVEEPYFHTHSCLHWILAGSVVILMMVAMVVLVVSVTIYRVVVAILLSSLGYFWFVASASHLVVNLIFILILSKISISLAHFLTKWEVHHAQAKYKDTFTFQVFIQFVTFYSSPIYIVFFKGKFTGYPGNYLSFLGIRSEECNPVRCFIELVQGQMVALVGKQIIHNVQEVAILGGHGPSCLPGKLKCWWHKHKLLSTKKAGEEGKTVLMEQEPWVMAHQLLELQELPRGRTAMGAFALSSPWVLEGEGLPSSLWDRAVDAAAAVLSLLAPPPLPPGLRFGFITIFVAACPLTPIFALLSNWVEICLGACKFICDYHCVAQGISSWFSILEAIAHLTVISNAFLIAFTSDFLPRGSYKYVHDSSLHCYVTFTLAYVPWDFVLQSNTTCRVFRDRDVNLTLTYWQLLAILLGFIVVFEHVVFFIGYVIAWLVPDIPESMEVKVKREWYLVKEALAENKVLLERQEARSKASVMDLAAGRD
ncbi:LOW QUALITY PROTEIN: anoctamin-7 [Leptosomus discolor]